MTTPFSLSDEELDRVMMAAAMLPTRQRDSFVRSVAGRVAGLAWRKSKARLNSC
jgi:hypothetical protein